MKPKFITYRCFKNFDFELFHNNLVALPWFNIIREISIDNKIRIFNCYLLLLFDVHAPIRHVRVTKPKAPWITPNLRLLMRERDKALQKFKCTRSGEDWASYKNLRNYTLSIVINEKKGYLNSVCSKHDLKKTWRALKNLNVHV